jgi:hypothetical protein
LKLGKTFDVIFTSPPYFDFEIYSDHPGQSVALFPQFEGWVVKFLFKTLRNVWQVLGPNGHLIVHLADTGKSVCEPMVLFAEGYLPECEYCGALSSLGFSERARPMWVWQRSASANASRSETARSLLRQHYPLLAAGADELCG